MGIGNPPHLRELSLEGYGFLAMRLSVSVAGHKCPSITKVKRKKGEKDSKIIMSTL